jgi:uncharacterized protein (TIGR00661 family)
MARIIYGISGEGWGHAARSREVLTHLKEMGHDLAVVTYDRGVRYLEGRFPLVEVEGLNIATVDNRVSVSRTVRDGLVHLVRGHPKYLELKREFFPEFKPDLVITDFEPMTAHLARHFDLPLITIDNQHMIRYVDFPCPNNLRPSMLMTEIVIGAFVPAPDLSLVTTFYFGKVKNERTFLFPPILTDEVLRLTPTDGGSIVVYSTYGYKTVLDTLATFTEQRFLIYGSGRTGLEGNLVFRPYGREVFLKDLAACKGVIATAGFTLISEALYLRKPYLGIPVKNQFEQEINAYLIEELNYGARSSDGSRDDIEDFLDRSSHYSAQLESYRSSDNSDLFARIDVSLSTLTG